MLKTILTFLIPIFFVCAGTAQVMVQGKVLDAETGAAVPYVNIGVRRLGVGTVSDESGMYALRLPNASEIIAFSSIGYQPVEVEAEALQRNGDVAMRRKPYQFKTVEITAGRFGDEQIFGVRNDTRGHSVGFGSRQLGAEIGAPIELGAPTLIRSAHFVLNHAQGDSMLFRVNIYDYRDGRIGGNLLPETVLIATRQQRGVIDVDLTHLDLILEGDVLLSLEWIRDDDGQGNVGITFDTKKSKKLRGIYVKDTSIGDFRRLDHHRSLKPCFYFVGKQ